MSTPLHSVSGSWQLGPFTPHAGAVLQPTHSLRFTCPILGEVVQWAAKDLFNPGAVVREGRVYLLVRAEDEIGRYSGTSRIGLAISDDGFRFEVEPEPVLFPADDEWQAWEWPGGCEDPRVVESPEGGYVCLYTAFDGKSACMFVASSPDLRRWTKHGPAFAGTPYARRWTKSGSVLTEVRDDRLVAARIGGRYWMYWGEGVCFAATSQDLVRWEPVEFDAAEDRYLTYRPGAGSGAWRVQSVPGQRVLRPVVFPRPGRFDSLLVEPGPPALMTDHGVILIYNGANHPQRGDPAIAPFAYQPGQLLLDPADRLSCVERPGSPFLLPAEVGAASGQVNNVCFAQGLVLFEGRWLLYYGMADSRIGCAAAPFQQG